ncbi:GntR family transcriptional regulator [Zavarzinella formosa]|uniref:GntR family transcriptional regulator n=1 Tax=Zavarzinella formosa TaxID=360055 RepID=UPI0002F7601C|nr:GntR family transcriptional regulator [Zavarzinella formosa]
MEKLSLPGEAMTVQRLSARDQIRRTITERILAGVYRPGDRLVELQIARELGVSQGPVREALRELEASRLVESEPNRGTRVRTVSARETREAYLVRGVLEQSAAPTAALAFKGNAGRLREACEAIIRAAIAGDLSEQAACNTAFHRMIVEASGNLVLLRLWDSLSFEPRPRLTLARPDAEPVRDAESHRPIVDALERGAAALAGRLLREHAESFAPPEEM